MKSNRLAFVSALGLCLLTLFMLNGAEAGTLNYGSHFPGDERVDPSEDMTFRINITLVDNGETLDALLVYFGNDYQYTMDTTCDEECGWDGDGPPESGIYVTSAAPNEIDAEDTVSLIGGPNSEIKYGFRATFSSSVDDVCWPDSGCGTPLATNNSGVKVNTLPSMSPDAAVTPNPGMPYDTFTVSVTYTDADDHDGDIITTVCETSALETCQAPFNLDKGVGDNSGGVVYSKTFTTEFGGDDITVVLNASDSYNFALLNRTATFEIDTDKPWLESAVVSALNAGENEEITISAVYCVFDVNATNPVVSVDVGGVSYPMASGGSNSNCLNGLNFSVTTTIDWQAASQAVAFTASNDNDTCAGIGCEGGGSFTITINDAPTLASGSAERHFDIDNFVINVTAADVNEDDGDTLSVFASIQFDSAGERAMTCSGGLCSVTVAEDDIINQKGGIRTVTFRVEDSHGSSVVEDFGNSIDVAKTSSFILTGPGDMVSSPGSSDYVFTVENNGNFDDIFTLSASSLNNWVSVSSDTSVTVAYGGSDTFTIVMDVPYVAAGTTDSWSVDVIAGNNATQTDSDSGTTTVTVVSGHTVSIADSSSNADPDSTATYYFTITNTGNADEAFAYTTDGNPSSGITASLGMGEFETVEVSHTVPLNAVAGATFTLTFTSGSESESATTTANQNYDLLVSQSGTDENVGNVKPGDTFDVEFTITNDGNGPDSATVSFFGDWVATANTVKSVSKGASVVVSASVSVPANVASGSSSSVSISVVGGGNSVDTSYTVNVKSEARSVNVTGTNAYTLNKGASGDGNVTVKNNGVLSTFTVVSMSSSLTFAVSEITLAEGQSGVMSFVMTADETGPANFTIEDIVDGVSAKFEIVITARVFSTDMSGWGLANCNDTGVVCNYDQDGVFTGSSYTKAGSWTTSLVYTDVNDQQGTKSFVTSVENIKPMLAAPTLTSAEEGTEQVFEFTIPTDSDGSISHFVIEFGDGESVTFQGSDLTGSTVTARHTYAEDAVGVVTVKATAYDNSGDSTVQEVSMTVNDRTVALEGNSYVYNLVALVGFFLLGLLLAGTSFKMQRGEIAGDEEMNERDRQRLESVERRMESLSEREELLEVSAYDASRAATKLEEHISAFNEILVRAQEIAAKEKLEELEAAEKAKQDADEQTQLDLDDPDIEMVAERFHGALGRLVTAREELSKIEEQLAYILKMERDEQLEKLTEMTESYESTKRKIDALHSSKEARDAAAVENNITNLLSAAASGGSLGGADFGDFGDLDSGDDEYEVEIYEDEDGSFYYIDPDTGEEVPCDEDGNAL